MARTPKKYGEPVMVLKALEETFDAVSRRLNDDEVAVQGREVLAAVSGLESFTDCSVEKRMLILIWAATALASANFDEWSDSEAASGTSRIFKSSERRAA